MEISLSNKGWTLSSLRRFLPVRNIISGLLHLRGRVADLEWFEPPSATRQSWWSDWHGAHLYPPQRRKQPVLLSGQRRLGADQLSQTARERFDCVVMKIPLALARIGMSVWPCSWGKGICICKRTEYCAAFCRSMVASIPIRPAFSPIYVPITYRPMRCLSQSSERRASALRGME